MKLIHGEALEEMQKLIDQGVKVDAIICDPPYGIMEGIADAKEKLGRRGKDNCEWDVQIDMKEMWRKIEKIRRNSNTPSILFCQDPFAYKLKNSNSVEFKYSFMWNKQKAGIGIYAKYQPIKQFEEIAVFYNSSKYSIDAFEYHTSIKNHFEGLGYQKKDVAKLLGYVQVRNIFIEEANTKQVKSLSKISEEKYKVLVEHFADFDFLEYGEYLKLWVQKQTYNPQMREGNKYPINILNFKKVESQAVHPTQKPVELMEYLIKTYTNEGDTVLDFTMGSGSTGVACKNLNRNFIGIELDEQYYNIAKERIGGK